MSSTDHPNCLNPLPHQHSKSSSFGSPRTKQSKEEKLGRGMLMGQTRSPTMADGPGATTDTHRVPSLSILDFPLLSAATSVGLSAPGGMSQPHFLKEPEPLVTRPFSGQDCITWPFIVTTGPGSTKKHPSRSPGIDYPNCVTAALLLFISRVNPPPQCHDPFSARWSLDTRSSEHPGGRRSL